MSPFDLSYEQLHRSHAWAYGQGPDRQLADLVDALPAGRALDLGGGQGRHALWLASLGFEVELVDSSALALEQARTAAAARGLVLGTVCSNAGFYEPSAGLQVVVAALIFHLPAPHLARRIAGRLRTALDPGGLLYLSVPGFTAETEALLGRVLEESGCGNGAVERHLVTREERPRLPVPRRYETRAFGFRS